uniref:NTR domain-containing protein n=1 Tax=Steinernema glaseri TaxID=37863 RepID=A0A1I7YRU6_9BILA
MDCLGHILEIKENPTEVTEMRLDDVPGKTVVGYGDKCPELIDRGKDGCIENTTATTFCAVSLSSDRGNLQGAYSEPQDLELGAWVKSCTELLGAWRESCEEARLKKYAAS